MDLGLAGAHVVVAGGTKGMGLAAAECFAEDGANVAVLARRQGPLDEALASRSGAPTRLRSPPI
jgi:3-oxoacyl-[acyl-carrier protein] reductase